VFDREKCLALLATVPIGRVVHTHRALPAITPVTFVLDGEDVAIRPAGPLAVAVGGAVVAFEADNVDPDTGAGWAVTVVGPALLTGQLIRIPTRNVSGGPIGPPVLPQRRRP
jgi:uncharacterized protein